VRTTLGKPPKEKEQRERTTMTSIKIIKSLDEECASLCEESTQVWTKLIEDMNMKVVEERLRNAHDKV